MQVVKIPLSSTRLVISSGMDTSQIFQKYLEGISQKASSERTSEYGYRTEFETMLKSVFKEINVGRIDHDAKAVDGSKPDFVIVKSAVPILYVETKDIGVSLDKVEKSAQMSRYYGYANLVLTDYLEFRFYRNGERYEEPIVIGEYDKKERNITLKPENFEHLGKSLIDFTLSHKEPIKSGLHLSKIMGGKAQRIRDNMRDLLAKGNGDELMKVYETIKKMLVHDLKKEDFADMYAQTLVYGLFVARYHDDSPESFSREEARTLMPKSNPFLMHFFDHIAGPKFNKRLEYIVEELCEVFSHADVQKLMEDYYGKDKWGESQKGPDPVIHFYEDFLDEYDPKLRKKMGAYYTPLPVVQFIMRSVDQILKKEFKLRSGLADTSKLEDGKNHKVQVLDPAVGTGTFISAVIGEIYKKFLKSGQKGRWPTYVHNDLLPRLHGFELMMAPYTIAHLKLSMAFRETGFKYFSNRLGIYLTNSLESADDEQQDMFAFGLAESIAEESKEAAKIKKDTPIMVVLGNPPYSVSSQNKGEWITNLIKEYKKDLNERNIQPLSDDYIKFIRFAEHFIEKNGTGVVAMITNNSFIDGIIHRQMRKHLLETFDDIYVLDLHGNSKKKETAPDGGKDENVFDIQQGVAISLFVRTSNDKDGLGTVHHADLYGEREKKFDFLNKNDMGKIKWKKLKNRDPHYFFVPKDFELIEEYNSGFQTSELFVTSAVGVVTARDSFTIKETKAEVREVIENFLSMPVEDARVKYGLGKDVRDWTLSSARLDLQENYPNNGSLTSILYRPFDFRYTFYTGRTKGFYSYPRDEVMKHYIIGENVGLILSKQFGSHKYFICLATKLINDKSSQPFAPYYNHPLYVYLENGTRKPNLNKGILDKVQKIIGKVTPEEIFDYIYAVLHSPTYRERYKEFLKIDFPRVPYPKDKKIFNKLVKIGSQLRELHLMESAKLDKLITTYPESGSDTVKKIEYKDGKVYINKDQYFGKVPEIAWEFYIGGYQPAQKWLKDRKDRTLTNEEIEHYQKIIVALVETDKLMKKVDEVVPKWPMK